MIVGLHSQFQVAHHDFTRFSPVPNVALVCDVPESMEHLSTGECVCAGGKRVMWVCMYVCVRVHACLQDQGLCVHRE